MLIHSRRCRHRWHQTKRRKDLHTRTWKYQQQDTHIRSHSATWTTRISFSNPTYNVRQYRDGCRPGRKV